MTKPAPETPHITAAVVNWNGRAFLPELLRSLRTQEDVRLDILLIDNASSDESVDYVRENHPEVRVLANSENRGYSGALNQAARDMRGDYLLALNTDLSLEPRFCAELAACIERHRDEHCGYAQGKVGIMREDGAHTDRLYSTGHLFPPNRLCYNRGAGQRDVGQYEREERIPGANAACLLFRRDMLDDMRTEVDVFDEIFPMYGGDVDFDWLANQRGWAPWYCPAAVAWHIGEGSSRITRRGVDPPYINNRFLIMIKNDRLRDIVPDLPCIVWRNVTQLGSLCLARPSMALRLPAHLLRHLPRAIHSRRATRRLRRNRAIPPREWMLKSREELRRTTRLYGSP